MPTLRAPIARLALALLFMVSCSTSSPVEAGLAPLAERPEALDCASHIDRVSEVPEGFTIALDAVALPSLDTHQRGRSGPDNDPEASMRFSKIPLLVKEGTAFTIAVAPESQSNAQIAWSATTSADPATGIESDGCEVDGGPPWLVFAGGVWTTERGCVALLVENGGETARTDLAIGAACGNS